MNGRADGEMRWALYHQNQLCYKGLPLVRRIELELVLLEKISIDVSTGPSKRSFRFENSGRRSYLNNLGSGLSKVI